MTGGLIGLSYPPTLTGAIQNAIKLDGLESRVYIGSGPHAVRPPGYNNYLLPGEVHYYAGVHGYWPFEGLIDRLNALETEVQQLKERLANIP